MQALLTVLVTWLSVNLGLPANYEHPRVEFVPPARMTEIRYAALASVQAGRAVDANRAAPAAAHDVHAIYDTRSRVIYLPEGWTGTSPAEISLLVHELVHHLQNVGRLKYQCAEAREKLAYAAQAKWLELFGKTLADEFRLDPMTVLVRTNCFF